MEAFFEELMNKGIGRLMEKSREQLLEKDEIFLRDKKDSRELEQRYMELDLTQQQRIIIQDYIACIQTTGNRYGDISYMAGVRDAVRMFFDLDLLKTEN